MTDHPEPPPASLQPPPQRGMAGRLAPWLVPLALIVAVAVTIWHGAAGSADPPGSRGLGGHGRAPAEAGSAAGPGARGAGGPAVPPFTEHRPDTATVTVGGPAAAAPVPADFIGWSFEYPAVPGYAGQDPAAVDPALVRILAGLADGAPVIRVGGDSGDGTWWPIPRRRAPVGVSYALSSRWAAVTRALARALHARLVLGINLKADDPAASAYEARRLLAEVGRANVAELELGNEPSLYAALPWFRRPDGRRVYARHPGYSFPEFFAEFERLRRLIPPVPLAGPALGGSVWMQDLPHYLRAAHGVRLVTVHRYPLNRCLHQRRSPSFATVANLLAPVAGAGIGQHLAGYARTAHAVGARFRVDEINSVACGGKYGISDRFASALWAPDALFGLLAVGVDGINVHTFPGAQYAPFTFALGAGGWRATARPLLYGLTLFHQAAPAGARLLSLHGRGPVSARAWATRAADGTVRILLVNDAGHPQRYSLRLPRSGTLTLTRLSAPGLTAATDITLGGQSFDADGRLTGPPALVHLAAPNGKAAVDLAPASAALLTLR